MKALLVGPERASVQGHEGPVARPATLGATARNQPSRRIVERHRSAVKRTTTKRRTTTHGSHQLDLRLLSAIPDRPASRRGGAFTGRGGGRAVAGRLRRRRASGAGA